MTNHGELRSKFSTFALEQIRENVRRTIMSYRSPWDLYTELIQNAVDAIIDEFGYENIGKGELILSFDTDKREIYIEDNGIGIKSTDIASILVMGESIKRREGRGKYGFMGYGFTFVAFQTNFLKIESINGGIKATRTYNDLHKFVFENADLPLSEEEKNSENEEFTYEKSGTKITLSFPIKFPDETLEKNIKSAFYHVTSESILEYILRTKSAVGIVDSIFNEKITLFDLQVTVDGELVSIETGHLTTRKMVEKMFPSGNFYTINDYSKFIEMTDHLDQSAKKVARKAMLIDGNFENVKVGSIDPLNIDIYVAETSKGHLNEYNKRLINSDEYEKVNVENGIWLAIDGLPTGICLDNFNHPSYLPFTVIVNVNKEVRNELDSGRKGITAYRAEQIVNVIKRLLKEKMFIDYREYVLGVDSRIVTDGYDPKRELRNKLSNKKKFDIDLIHQYFPLENEQEVITLFTELLSKGFLPGYIPKVISGFDVYDGLYDYKTHFPQELLLPEDPLGISESIKNQYSNLDKEIVIEFKLLYFAIEK